MFRFNLLITPNLINAALVGFAYYLGSIGSSLWVFPAGLAIAIFSSHLAALLAIEALYKHATGDVCEVDIIEKIARSLFQKVSN